MMLHRNAATAAASRASGQATNADFHCSVAVVIIALLLLLLAAVLAPLWIDSERIDKTTIRPSDVQAVAEHWASEAGWSVIGVTATGDRVLVNATGPNPAPTSPCSARTLTPLAWWPLRLDGEPADGLSSAGRAPPGKTRADDQTQPRASTTVRWPATTASSAPPGSFQPRPAEPPDRRTPGRHHGMSGCRAAKSAGTWFPLPAKAGFGSGDRSSGWVRRGLPGASPLVSWLTVGPGAGLGGPGIRRGVVAVRCPACTAEQRLEGQQDHASHRHPDTSSGQDVQGIVHP